MSSTDSPGGQKSSAQMLQTQLCFLYHVESILFWRSWIELWSKVIGGVSVLLLSDIIWIVAPPEVGDNATVRRRQSCSDYFTVSRGTGYLFPSVWKAEIITSPFQAINGNPCLWRGRLDTISEKVNSNSILIKGGIVQIIFHLCVRIGLAMEQVHISTVIRWESNGMNPFSLLVKHE